MKKGKLLATTLCLSAVFAAGVTAAPTIRNITAQVRSDYTVTLNGVTQDLRDANGDIVYPLSYDGSTYLPIRTVGNLTGTDVSWNGNTKTISLTNQTTSNNNNNSSTTNTSTTTQTGIPSEDQVKLDDYDARAEDLVYQVNNITPASGYMERYQQYRELDREIDTLDEELDRYEDEAEYRYRSGSLTREQYQALNRAINQIDNKVSDLDDVLEYKLGIDD